jgi:hypothetical protein
MMATNLRLVRRFLLRVPMALLLVGFLGQVDCAGQSEEKGPDCASLCEKGMKECPDAPRVDCDSQCLFEDARAEATGCRKHVDAISKCSAELDDICTTAEGCDAELEDFWTCVLSWCMSHPSSQYCARPEGS